jgi:hypothetical protein
MGRQRPKPVETTKDGKKPAPKPKGKTPKKG